MSRIRQFLVLSSSTVWGRHAVGVGKIDACWIRFRAFLFFFLFLDLVQHVFFFFFFLMTRIMTTTDDNTCGYGCRDDLGDDSYIVLRNNWSVWTDRVISHLYMVNKFWRGKKSKVHEITLDYFCSKTRRRKNPAQLCSSEYVRSVTKLLILARTFVSYNSGPGQ